MRTNETGGDARFFGRWLGRIVLPALVAVVALAASPESPLQQAVAQHSDADPSPYFLDLNLVHLIVCDGGTGSGARIGSDLILTAAHVAAAMPCAVDGMAVTIEQIDVAGDYALLRTQVGLPRQMNISCAEPVSGGRYLAVGWAAGLDFVAQPVIGTSSYERRQHPFVGAARFRGSIYAGMSGGPVIDSEGDVIAIVNGGRRDGRPTMVGRLLRDTTLCGAAK